MNLSTLPDMGCGMIEIISRVTVMSVTIVPLARERRGGTELARIRSIKPEAFTSETLSALPVLLRWTFAGLWTYADDDGRARANAGLIKAAVWPLDDDVTPAHIGAFLDQLEDARLICRYEVDGKAYLHVVNFAEHQHPNRPLPSKLPACTRRTHGGLTAGSVSTHPKPPDGPSPGVATGTEATGLQATPETADGAGQGTRSEHAVSTHEGLTAGGERRGIGDGGEVPPSAGAAPRPGRKPRQSSNNAGDVIAAFVEGATAAGLDRPPENIRKRVGADAVKLLAEGYALERLVASARAMGATTYNDIAIQVRKDDPAAQNGTNRGSHQPYRNPSDPADYHGELRAP